jgi:hypothetical protein
MSLHGFHCFGPDPHWLRIRLVLTSGSKGVKRTITKWQANPEDIRYKVPVPYLMLVPVPVPYKSV